MGTRSLTVINDEEGREICVMYRQFDGYPEGHGKELAEFLSGMTVVNGLSDRNSKVANGCGCLAAQIISHFKKKPGGIYLHSPGTRDLWEDFIYTVSGKVGEEPVIDVLFDDESRFCGPASQYATSLENYLLTC